jgi:hypothetical protein
MKQFMDLISGTLSVAWYAAEFVFAFIGLFIRWSITAYMGVKNQTNNSPDRFSWNYWWTHNAKLEAVRIIRTVLIIFVCLRFSVEWFNIPVEYNMSLACGIGLAFDWVLYFIKKKTTDPLK